ncbi:MAG: hypothetical protein HZB36_04600 [Candidatus Omnitrophica bacterium]|nr:hypothetical protein [Candidatus Omnitrophota bacterium]
MRKLLFVLQNIVKNRAFLFLLSVIVLYFFSIRFTYQLQEPFSLGGPDFSRLSTYLFRIGHAEVPFVDFYPVYGPLFLYGLFFIYKLMGGQLASYIRLYGFIMPFLGVLAFSVFAWFFFRAKRFAGYFMLLVLIFNSFGLDADGSNGYILRIFPIFLCLLILRRSMEGPKNWLLPLGIIIGMTSMYEYPAFITLTLVTLFYFLFSFMSQGSKKTLQDGSKFAIGVMIPLLLWALFFAFSRTFFETFIFIGHLVDKVPAYFLDIPANFKNISVFFQQQFYYLVVLFAYAAALIYLVLSLFMKKKIDMRFQVSFLLLLVGGILSRRVFIEYWRILGIVIVPLVVFVLFNLEQAVKNIKSKALAIVIESGVVGCVCIFSLMTSFNVQFLKGRFFSAPIAPAPAAQLEYFEKAGMLFRKDEVQPCREVLEYIEKNIPENEDFYTFPWGLYNYFLERRVPVRINSDYLGLADPLFFERMIIEDLKKRSINHVIVNRQNTLGVVALGPRCDVADFYCWGGPKDVSIVRSEIAKFILVNYETEAILPAAVILKKRNSALSYPPEKSIKNFRAKELYQSWELDGAKQVRLTEDALSLSDINKTVTLAFDLSEPLAQPCSLLRLKIKFKYHKLDKLWNQGFFDCTLNFVNDDGVERSSTVRHHASEIREGQFDLPFIYAPIRIASGSIVLDFRPSVFSGPPASIVLGDVEFLQHQDKGYAFSK